MAITVYPPYGSSSTKPSYVAFGGTTVDAFGRLRVSQPYTLFDSQSRYAADPAYSYSTSGTGATTTWQTDKSSINLYPGTSSAGSAVAQSFRSFPYQPGKSLLTLQTFTLAAQQTGLTQRVGLFNTANGVYLEQAGTSLPTGVSLNIRSASGSGNQQALKSAWNVDKFDGTGPSGVTLDLTKTQIFFIDIEWLGVGSVRCGFVVNGVLYVAHVFNNANVQSFVYMTTAILPLRFEITTTSIPTGTPVLQQICSSVISEGGYEQTSQVYNARVTTAYASTLTTTFVPLISIRLNSSFLGAIVIPSAITGFPMVNGDYEFALVKNATGLTSASWATTLAAGQVDVDTAATAMTIASTDQIVQQSFATSSAQSTASAFVPTGYNWDLQLGVSLANASDTYTLAARTVQGTAAPGSTGVAVGNIAFYNLTV